LNDIVQSALPPSAYRFEAVLSNAGAPIAC